MTQYRVTFQANIWEERIIEAESQQDAWQKARQLALTDETLGDADWEPEWVNAIRRDPNPYKSSKGVRMHTPGPEDWPFEPRNAYSQNREDYE